MDTRSLRQIPQFDSPALDHKAAATAAGPTGLRSIVLFNFKPAF